MTTNAPGGWPQRPERFYDDWAVFCREVLSHNLRNKPSGEELAAILLAGGSMLGATGLIALVKGNEKIINEKGAEWGIPDLGKWALGGGAVLGAVLGGIGGALLTRTLSRFTTDAAVESLEIKLGAARREFEAIRREYQSGMYNRDQQKAAVEALFWGLTQQPT